MFYLSYFVKSLQIYSFNRYLSISYIILYIYLISMFLADRIQFQSMSGKNDAIFCIFCKNRVPIAEFADHEKLELHQNTIKVILYLLFILYCFNVY